MPEVRLGIGRHQTDIAGWQREGLTWFKAQGDRHLSTIEPERNVQQR